MATELEADRTVRAAMRQAWVETLADEPGRRRAREQGGWIYMNLTTGRLSIQRARPPEYGTREGTYHIDLNHPPLVQGSVVVGAFHTHPTGSSHNDTDYPGAVPLWIVQGVGPDGPRVESYGQPIRAGSWSSAAQYPLFPP